jgi:hypothetical protein
VLQSTLGSGFRVQVSGFRVLFSVLQTPSFPSLSSSPGPSPPALPPSFPPSLPPFSLALSFSLTFGVPRFWSNFNRHCSEGALRNQGRILSVNALCQEWQIVLYYLIYISNILSYFYLKLSVMLHVNILCQKCSSCFIILSIHLIYCLFIF